MSKSSTFGKVSETRIGSFVSVKTTRASHEGFWQPGYLSQRTRVQGRRLHASTALITAGGRCSKSCPTTEEVIVDKPVDLEGARQTFHNSEVLEQWEPILGSLRSRKARTFLVLNRSTPRSFVYRWGFRDRNPGEPQISSPARQRLDLHPRLQAVPNPARTSHLTPSCQRGRTNENESFSGPARGRCCSPDSRPPLSERSSNGKQCLCVNPRGRPICPEPAVAELTGLYGTDP